MKNLLACLVFALISMIPVASLNRAHYNELVIKSRELTRQQDWKAVREVYSQIVEEMGVATPAYMRRIASVELLLGHKAEAIRWMELYASTGMGYDVANDNVLKPLATEPGYQKVAEQMKARTAPVQKAELVCVLPLADIMPEDITYEKRSGTFIVSSIQHHTLYRVTLPKHGEKECGMQEMALDDSLKRWPTMALASDAKHNLLWVTTSAIPDFAGFQLAGFPKGDSGKASLLVLNATGGKLVRRFDLGNADAPALLGDMLLAEDDSIYVTDGLGGGVYRVRGNIETAKLEKIGGDFINPQTPVLARDGKRLFVSDYLAGIGVIDLNASPSQHFEYLPHPENIAVSGLDGLYLDGDSLVGMQNGATPGRLIRLRLNKAQTEIVSAEVLEQSTDRLGEFTHAVLMNGMFYVSANVGWDKVDDHGRLRSGEQFTTPIILRFPAEGNSSSQLHFPSPGH